MTTLFLAIEKYELEGLKYYWNWNRVFGVIQGQVKIDLQATSNAIGSMSIQWDFHNTKILIKNEFSDRDLRFLFLFIPTKKNGSKTKCPWISESEMLNFNAVKYKINLMR